MPEKKKKPGSSKADLPGYPSYPPEEDLYNQAREEADLDPENPARIKPPNEMPNALNEKGFIDDPTGGDLDVPGSELDDQAEAIGNEDEENNLYSMGGENHENLEEPHE